MLRKLFLPFVFLLSSFVYVHGQKNPHFKTSYQFSFGLIRNTGDFSGSKPPHSSLDEFYRTEKFDFQFSTQYSFEYFNIGLGAGFERIREVYPRNWCGKFFLQTEIGNGYSYFPISLILKAGLKDDVTSTYSPYFSGGPSLNLCLKKQLIYISLFGYVEYQNSQKKKETISGNYGTPPWYQTFNYVISYKYWSYNIGLIISLYPETLIKKNR